MDGSAPVIEVRGLTKIFRTYRKRPGVWGAWLGLFHRETTETRAVDGVTFSVGAGECVGFLGPNGAGKTTVMKMLTGLIEPTGGEATVLGYRPWERQNALKRQFALLMGQKNALWWDLPARESLELNRVIYGVERGEFRKLVGALSELLEVDSKLDVMVRELSLGERMKMELIAALVHSPRVLFLDEPTIGLDVTSQQRVREFLRGYHRERGVTTLLTSHYMGDVEALCQRVMVISEGRLVFDGPLAGIVDRFSSHKILNLQFGCSVEGRFEGLGEVLEQGPMGVRLRVERGRVAEVCREVLSGFPVSDLAVQETTVEEVIQRVFSGEGTGS
jgi:ABC-2 type transport system ATP-binding protein